LVDGRRYRTVEFVREALEEKLERIAESRIARRSNDTVPRVTAKRISSSSERKR
jgi:hypothetical protein